MDYEVGHTHEVEVRTLVRQFLFCKNSGECGEKKISPQNSTLFLQKFTAFSAFNAKRCGRFAVKKVFFHRYSPLILHFFCQNLDPDGSRLRVLSPGLLSPGYEELHLLEAYFSWYIIISKICSFWLFWFSCFLSTQSIAATTLVPNFGVPIFLWL